jgi:hypothetical protein
MKTPLNSENGDETVFQGTILDKTLSVGRFNVYF